MYRKRSGTSGISGQLNETKLISLILFRAKLDDDIEEFHIASNMADIGAFDDICFKVKIKGTDTPIYVFVQAKHKDDDESFLKFDLIGRLYDSYIKIKKYSKRPRKNDKIFNKDFDINKCVFVLYTNGKYSNDSDCEFDSNFVSIMNKLIATGKGGSKILYNDEVMNELNETISKVEIQILAERFAKFLNNETNNKQQTKNIMHDEYIQRYHVILAREVVDVSDVQRDPQKPNSKWRTIKFRDGFFNSEDKNLRLLEKTLLKQVVQNQAHSKSVEPVDESSVKDLLTTFFSDPCAETLSPLMGTHVLIKNGDIHFIHERPETDVQELERVKLPHCTIEEAEVLAGRKILSSLQLKVPVTFGNKELIIRGNNDKVKARLTHLNTYIADMCKKSQLINGFNVVTFDDNVEDGLLSPNGGIGGAVGNMLVFDKNNKLLQFAEDSESLQNNAKALHGLSELSTKNLKTYRFNTDAASLPKLSFDCSDIAKEISNKIMIYAQQKNHYGVEEVLKEEIRQYHNATFKQSCHVIKPETICQNYHYEVQKWWLLSDTGPYLSKTSDIYERARNNTLLEPQISSLQTTFYMTKMKLIEYTTESLKSLEILSKPKDGKGSELKAMRSIIISDITSLTAIKLIQYLRNKENKFAILDLECIFNLETEDFCGLKAELRKTEKIPIVICDNLISEVPWCEKFIKELGQAISDKQKIIITNTLVESVKNRFPISEQKEKEEEIYDDNIIYETHSMTDFNAKSQKNIIRSSKIVFQGFETDLSLIVDDTSIPFIEGAVLNKILQNETFEMGELLTNRNYEEIKHLYKDRTVEYYEDRATNNDGVNSTPSSDHSSSNNLQASSSNDSLSNDAPKEINIFKLLDIEDDFTDQVPIPRHIGLKTFHDIKQDVVLLTAAAGMGKSTLLTHLSIKTKEGSAKETDQLWIVRLNLLVYSSEFRSWKNDKSTVVDTLKTLKLMCQITLKNSNINFKLEEVSDRVYLKYCSGDVWARFHLNMFLHFYNEGKLIFLFDGFDEICPHYKDEVIKFLQIVKNYPRKNKMWITSRPYNALLPDLENNFGKSYELNCFDKKEQAEFLRMFWEDKLKTKKLTEDSAKLFLTIMSNNVTEFDFKLQIIFFHFHGFISSKFPHLVQGANYEIPHLKIKLVHVKKLIKEPYSYRVDSEVNKFMGTPLLLSLAAEYFVNEILDASKLNNKANFNTIRMYEKFIETKLKKILYEDKYDMNTNIPYIEEKCEIDLQECIARHKKIGAHAVFGSPLFSRNYLHFDEFKDMGPFNIDKATGASEFDTIAENIRSGKEKTGLISYITCNGIPSFIHKTFQEYFATEFICDIFKSNKYSYDVKRLLWIVVLTLIHSDSNKDLISIWIGKKIKLDDEFNKIVEDICRRQPLIGEYVHQYAPFDNNTSLKHAQIRLLNATLDDFEDTSFAMNHLEEYMSGRRSYDLELTKAMKPHLRQYFEPLFISIPTP